MKPLVSILVTVYNREDFVAETLDSILASSFTNFEVIVVDDCSSDKSVEIIKEYQVKDSRIKLFQNKDNLGDYGNRNEAASKASGKYLKYLDADDLIYPYSLQIMVDVMEANPDVALGLSFNVIDDLLPYPSKISSSEALSSFLYGRNVLGVGPSASIIRRECFEKEGGFSGEQYIGDVELWTRLAMKWPLVKFPPSLVWWRQHPDQQIVFERKNYSIAAKRYWHKIKLTDQLNQLLKSEQLTFARNYIKHRQSRLIINTLMKRRDFKNARLLMKESKLGFYQVLHYSKKAYGVRRESKHHHSFI